MFITLWFIAGVLAVGIANHSFRYEFPEFYIENYWTLEENNERPAYKVADFTFLFMNFLCGFISFGVALLMSRKPLGLCYVFRKWTQEEAKKLFPDNYNYDVKYNRRTYE